MNRVGYIVNVPQEDTVLGVIPYSDFKSGPVSYGHQLSRAGKLITRQSAWLTHDKRWAKKGGGKPTAIKTVQPKRPLFVEFYIEEK
jgi:hypothetical protein